MSEQKQAMLPDIVKTLELNAPIQKVWNAVATSEGIAAWYMPNDFEPLPGKDFTLFSQYGPSPCKVTEIDPPNRLTFTWGEDWVITFELRDLGGKTGFTLIHSGWIEGKVIAQTGMSHNNVRDIMNNGWASQVLPRLVQYAEA